MNYTGGGLPGPQTARSQEYRNPLRGPGKYLTGGVVIDASLSRDPLNTGYVHTLRPGILLGMITATGLWRPSIIGTLTAAYALADTTSLTVSAATATEVARLISDAGGNVSLKLVGPATDAAAGAIVTTAFTASAASGTTITMTADIAVDKVSGSWIMPADGSETPLGILGGPDGIRVTDVDGNNVDQQCARLLIGGEIDIDYITNYPASTSTTRIAQIKAWLNNASNYGFTFSDAFSI